MHRFSADQDSFETSFYNHKKPPEWPLQLFINASRPLLNAYLFLGHFPVKKILKFCPVETSSVRHARIHNLCCQQFSSKGLVKLACTTMHGPPSWNSGLTCVPFSSILSWLETMVSWSVSSIYASFYRFWGQQMTVNWWSFITKGFLTNYTVQKRISKQII